MCVCVYRHAASLQRRLKGKLRGEEEARRERKCRGKPLTAVAQGSGFLCRSRKTTVSEASRKSGGILSAYKAAGPVSRYKFRREKEKKEATTVWHCF